MTPIRQELCSGGLWAIDPNRACPVCGATDEGPCRAHLRTALEGVLWMAEEWLEHIGGASMEADCHRAALAAAKAALGQQDGIQRTMMHHSHHADGRPRQEHCCGCWHIDPARLIATCNECGEERDLSRAAHLCA